VLDQDVFSESKILVEDSEFGLNLEAIRTFNSNGLVKLSEVLSASHVTESSITSLSNVEVLLFKSKFGKSFPVSFGFRGQSERFEDIDS
jgi:hypothetical protein